MSKYEALQQFLGAAPGGRKRLSFGEIERALGFKLPKSAYQYQAWWSNNPTGHSHSRAWVDAGWRTEDVDVGARQVTFQRIGKNKSSDENPPLPKSDPWGCMAGTVTIMPGVDLTAPSDEIWNAEEGRLVNE